MNFEAVEELQVFSDYLAPNLDVYEQAIYIFLFRHSYLEGNADLTIGLKSARAKMGFGAGDSRRPMSESTLTKKVQSLEAKGLLKKVDSNRFGTVLEISLPTETEYYQTIDLTAQQLNIEDLDFFNNPIGRKAVLLREGHKCFYCFASLSEDNYVMEHVVSRPHGDGGYRNIVAACRRCNNRKSEYTALTHLRNLLREHVLSEEEFRERVCTLDDLLAGKLVPIIDGVTDNSKEPSNTN